MDYIEAMDRVLDKLYFDLDDEQRDLNKITFWKEYQLFQDKKRPFDRSFIWNDEEVIKGNSWSWYKLCPYQQTTVLGYVACHVTSKILKIGAAERSWGVTKNLKIGKQGALFSEMMRKQSLIVCQASMNASRTMKHDMESSGTLWTEEDFNHNYTNQEDNLASEASAVVKKQSKTPTKEIWHAWPEP